MKGAALRVEAHKRKNNEQKVSRGMENIEL